jgi:peptide/nickel transport system substrate-binding protein
VALMLTLLLAVACGAAATATPAPAKAPQPAAAQPAAPATATPAPAKAPQPAAAQPAAPAATATPAPAPAQASKAKYGGILRVQVHLDPTGVDLHTPRGASQREFWIAAPALNYLVAEQPGGTPGPIIPDLAQSWDVKFNAGGTADWTFTLNPKARWHNGQPVTAEDIKFNFDRVKNPPKGLTIGRARPVGTYYKNVDDVVIDGNKIVVRTSTSSQDFLAAVALTNFPIYNKAATEALPQPLIRDYRELVGSGPFIPEDYKTGARYSLSRNKNYWADSSLPYLDGVEVLVMAGVETRLAALQTGQVDIAFPQLDASLYLQLQKMPHMTTKAVLGDVGAWYVQMNERRVPWNDVRVRRAISLGMDRNLVGQISERGLGSPYGILYPPGSPYALPVDEVKKLPGFAADKKVEFEQARRLLAEYSKETGYDFTQRIPMLTENRSENIEGATLLIQQLSNIGITGAVLDIQADAVTEEREIAHDFNIMIRRFGGPIEPDLHLQNQFVTGGARNFAAMSHPEIDRLYEAQRSSKIQEERVKIIQDMARDFWKVQGGSVPLWWRAQFQAYNKRVQDYNPTLAFSPNQNVTRVWLSK